MMALMPTSTMVGLNLSAILGGLLVAAVAVAGFQHSRYEILQEKHLRTQVALTAAEVNLDNQLELAEANQKIIDKWRTRFEEITRTTQAQEIEIQRLRSQELARSLSAPFEAGLDADVRRRNNLLRFTGEAGASDREAVPDQGGDSPGASSP